MSTYIQQYKKPIRAGELNKCDYIKEMKKAYFQQPRQTEKSCDGYRNQYTSDASHVCETCEWFLDNQGGVFDDRIRTDKSTS